jgi:spermidine/putrescine transport system substrate-binding protein
MSRPSRRQFLKSTATAAAGAALAMPHVRDAAAATLELRWLGWEHYNIAKIVRGFEKAYNVRVSSSYIDANSEAYTTLRAGGTADFDLVMGDGFWPRLYAQQGLTQPVDYRKIPNIDNVFSAFRPPKSTILQAEDDDAMVGAPNCWGGYGLTVNLNRIHERDAGSLSLLFNPKYGRRLSTSARLEENIALAGILAAHEMGTKDGARPDGKPFNPYVLTDAELEAAKTLLIKQKRLLVTRWNDENTLERLLRAEAVWASPEWSGIYRRIHFDALEGKTKLKLTHVLRPAEGGLGWVDSWAISAGVTSSEKLELCHKWIDWRLKPENMAAVATDLGWSPTVDVRSLIPRRYVETLFLDQTNAIHGLYQYDAPSSPEKWERVWSQVQAA